METALEARHLVKTYPAVRAVDDVSFTVTSGTCFGVLGPNGAGKAIEFVIAQVASRLLLIMAVTVFVYAGTSYFLDTRMEGSYLALFVVAMLGAICLISMGLMVAARVTSEELAGGLLNVISWPMMLLSGVWFSLEGTDEWVQVAANAFPLTHIPVAARAIMLDGATLTELAPRLLVLILLSTVFLTTGAAIFRWRAH